MTKAEAMILVETIPDCVIGIMLEEKDFNEFLDSFQNDVYVNQELLSNARVYKKFKFMGKTWMNDAMRL